MSRFSTPRCHYHYRMIQYFYGLYHFDVPCNGVCMCLVMEEMKTMRFSRLFRKRINRINLIGFITGLVLIAYYFGLFIHPFEIDYQHHFNYPLELDNLMDIVEMHKSGAQASPVKPINHLDYRLINNNGHSCRSSAASNYTEFEDIRLLIVVKSAILHRTRRSMIRKTWGHEKRFSDVQMRRIFVLGSCDQISSNDAKQLVLNKGLTMNQYYSPKCQDLIDEEAQAHGDIVQADFIDTYFNNTIKTIMGMKWSVNFCPKAQFTLFVDDDYYISIKNLMKFLRNPLEVNPIIYDLKNALNPVQEKPFDGRLFAGYKFESSPPMRHKPSKWFVTLEEYPYSYYPPYITAGAFVLSNLALLDMYYASFYTKLFRFDDIYMGILAKKVQISPLHNPNFYFWKKKYSPENYKSVIASHGFADPVELFKSWVEQKSFGNA